MNSNIKDPYLNYTDKVLFALEIALDKTEMDEVDATAVLIELGNYPELSALKKRVQELAEIYPSLKEVLLKETEEKAEDFDDIVQRYITYLIQNGQASKVVEVSTKAKTVGRSIQDLTQAFPDITNVLID